MKEKGRSRQGKGSLGLRPRLVAAVLVCALFAAGLAGTLFLRAMAAEYGKRQCLRAEHALELAGEQLRQGRAERARAVLAAAPRVLTLRLVDPEGNCREALEVDRAPPGLDPMDLTTDLGRGWRVEGRILQPDLRELAGALSLEAGLTLGGLVFLFFLILWPALGRLVTRPLRRLAAYTDRLSRGDFSGKAEERGSREIQELAHCLQKLGTVLEEQKRSAHASNNAMRRTFQQLRDIVDSLTEGVLVADSALDTILVNPAAEKLLQVEEAEAGGAPISASLPAGVQKPLWPIVADYEEGRATAPRSYEVEHKGRILRINTAPMRRTGKGDHFQGLVLAIMDVTRERESDRVKQDFLSSISHELRTPLTTIASSCEILSDMPPEDEETRRDFLRAIQVETERLTEMVTQLLDLSTLNAGKVILHREQVPLADLLGEVQGRFSDQASEAGLRLQVERPPGENGLAPEVDRKRIEQVIKILVGNSLKFTPKGGRIKVKADFVRRQRDPWEGEEEKEKPDTFRLTVTDTGPGVPPEQREKIFANFAQGGDPLTGKPKGPGLGLPLARSIITAHGGELRCEEAAEGAAFTFTVPLQAPRPRPEEKTEKATGEPLLAIQPLGEPLGE